MQPVSRKLFLPHHELGHSLPDPWLPTPPYLPWLQMPPGMFFHAAGATPSATAALSLGGGAPLSADTSLQLMAAASLPLLSPHLPAHQAHSGEALSKKEARLQVGAAAADGAQPRVLLRLLLRGLWLHIARCTRALSLPTAPSLLTASALLPLPLPLPLQAFAKYKQKREAKKLSYGKKIRYQSRKVGLATRRPVCTHVVLSGKWNGDSS